MLKNALAKAWAWLKAAHDKLKGYRTILVAFVLGSIDLLQATDIAPILPASWVPIWMTAHPFVFLALRLVTRGPVGVSP